MEGGGGNGKRGGSRESKGRCIRYTRSQGLLDVRQNSTLSPTLPHGLTVLSPAWCQVWRVLVR